MQFILYIVTSPYYLLHRIVKLGLSTDLYGRGGTYQTGCPPGFDPSHELEFVAAWTTDATTDSKLKNRYIYIYIRAIYANRAGQACMCLLPGKDR